MHTPDLARGECTSDVLGVALHTTHPLIDTLRLGLQSWVASSCVHDSPIESKWSLVHQILD